MCRGMKVILKPFISIKSTISLCFNIPNSFIFCLFKWVLLELSLPNIISIFPLRDSFQYLFTFTPSSVAFLMAVTKTHDKSNIKGDIIYAEMFSGLQSIMAREAWLREQICLWHPGCSNGSSHGQAGNRESKL